MLEVGDATPEVTLVDDSGAPFSTASLRGRRTVLFFYPKDDTPGCSSEASQFRDAYPSFQRHDVAIFGVSRDSVSSHCNFKEKFELPYRLLADTESQLCDAFGVIVEKNMYGKRSLGVQRSTFLIDPAGLIARVWPKVSVEGHAEDVLAAIS